MHFTKSLLVGATAIVAAVAQSSSLIAFTSTPATVTAGSDATLQWSGGDPSQPVTILLRRGQSENLRTVAVVNGAATGTSTVWHVPEDLPNGSDYTFQISQGVDVTNYSGRFSVTGGSTSSSATSSSSTSPTTRAPIPTGGVNSLTATTSAPTSASAVLQSAINSANDATTVAANNATTIIPGGGALGTGAVGSGASGLGGATGTALPRNTTLSRATLSASSSSAGSTSTAAETTSAGGEASSTGGGSSSTGAPTSGALDAASFASPLALIFSAVAAIVYLG
ncbi:MAG: hypothetical protein Q9201_002380 [Fulgogasparrea decipioides]